MQPCIDNTKYVVQVRVKSTYLYCRQTFSDEVSFQYLRLPIFLQSHSNELYIKAHWYIWKTESSQSSLFSRQQKSMLKVSNKNWFPLKAPIRLGKKKKPTAKYFRKTDLCQGFHSSRSRNEQAIFLYWERTFLTFSSSLKVVFAHWRTHTLQILFRRKVSWYIHWKMVVIWKVDAESHKISSGIAFHFAQCFVELSVHCLGR